MFKQLVDEMNESDVCDPTSAWTLEAVLFPCCIWKEEYKISWSNTNLTSLHS
jgi:hypothetical protein